MKNRKSILIAFVLSAAAIVVTGCSDSGKTNAKNTNTDQSSMEGMSGMEGMSEHGDAHAHAEGNSDETLYQCAMHPNIVAEKPGQCPICAMDLQPVQPIDAEGIVGRAPVRLTDQQRQLINIRTSPATTSRAFKNLSAPGVIQHDASKVFAIAAWTAGRIETLHVNKEETYVEKGDILYEIYSPDLYAAMQEYASLAKGPVAQESLIESARVRLLQIGLRPEQIEEIAQAGKAPLTIPIKSPASGIVMMKMVREGQYVKEGETLFTVVDLSELWLIAEVYEADLPFVQPGQKVVATTPAVPGESFVGEVELINHHIDPKTRTAKVRIVFENPEQTMHAKADEDGHRHHRLLPDMWMTAQLERDLGDQLSIPRSSIFDTGKRKYVFVEAEKGLFVPKEIEIGPRIDTRVIVSSGLEKGDHVVTDGVFLLDSESLLKASASGNDGAEETIASNVSDANIAGIPTEARAKLDAFWNAYLDLRAALAQDSLTSAQAGFQSLRERAESLENAALLPAVGKQAYLETLDAIQTQAQVGENGDLAAARDQFGRLSDTIIDWAASAPEVVTLDLNVASCPMWTSSPGKWIQSGEEIDNPFMGTAMLRCGSIEEALKKGSQR